MVRHGIDGVRAPAGRFSPERDARALVFLGGRLRVVEATAEDRCSVVDVETWADVHRLKLVGALTHAHVERPGPNSEYLVTRATAAVTVGPLTGRRSELAWFAGDGAGLRRVHRLFRRGPLAPRLATGLADETPTDLFLSAVLSDGMLVDGDELVSPRAVGEERQRLVRYTEAPVRAVVGEAVTQTRRVFLLGEDGLVTATAANDVRRWYAVVRGQVLERLNLSGDGAILCATAGRTLVMWSAEDGTLLAIRSLATPGTLRPAPVGRHAVWETAAGPELLSLDTSEAPLAPPARLDQAVRIESRELVVDGDTDGILRDLVAEVIDDGLAPSRFAEGAPRYESATLTAASSGAGPVTLLEPWQLTRGASSMWMEGFVLRGLVEEAPVQEAERRRRIERRDASLMSEANRNATRGSVKVSEVLEAAILASPDAREPYLVYGDWLLEQGDPRGELIALQVRLAETPNDAALRDRERALFAQHGKGWLGALARDFDGTWQLGFVHDLKLAHITTRKWNDLGALPAFRFVRTMTLSVLGDPSAFLVGAEARGYPKLLRDLTVSLRPDASARFLATLASSPIRTLTLDGPFDFAAFRAAPPALAPLETLRVTAPLSAAEQARLLIDLPNVPILFTAP